MQHTEDIIAIVCPDTHGRSFWKTAASNYDGSVPFIFLGDYLDPYKHEGITDEDSKKNFYEIWNFKEKWGDKIVLLLGNHDLSYKEYMFRCCRYSNYSGEWYTEFLNNNFDQFKIAYSIKNNDKTFIFSHAGIHPQWLKYHNLEEKYDSDYINSLFVNNKNIFNDIGYYRGGYLLTGSPVWADIREFANVKFPNKDIIQIVGHTQLVSDKIEFETINCIDSRQPFIISKENILKPYKTN